MRTRQRHLKKEFTWTLIIIEILLTILLIIGLSIDCSISRVTATFQFEYFLVIMLLIITIYGCHKILVKYGNRQVLNKFKDTEEG